MVRHWLNIDAFIRSGAARALPDAAMESIGPTMPIARPTATRSSARTTAASQAATLAQLRSLKLDGLAAGVEVDDWGMGAIDSMADSDLLEIIGDRVGRKATIITSQRCLRPADGFCEAKPPRKGS